MNDRKIAKIKMELSIPIDFTDGNKPNQEIPKPPGSRIINNGTSSIEGGFNHFYGGVISGFVIGVFTAMFILNLVNGG
ncbi:TPA: hypothetical protein NIK62_000107 [Vibrio cholerae]|uniref:hypothetical protein n=1 Tax=Vibrio cholerae TaxID=666 RepID=UPI00050C35A6|nr:hypothetical protein [Vibrio cholerae]EGR0073142.1 hypothetical protein [Vibrio cholerae]EJL6764543.1 hypothetical protein [Vibrio cholerae]EJL6959279.1 hypothetical protein [Vibrio cholerae]EKF9465771.1 hypothetical protein [Vibrio cholerae]EMC8696539.1 hypothetical protein [Vibrio cholerae]